MASIKQHKSGFWHVTFRYCGKQIHKSLGTTDRTTAKAMKSGIEETIHDLQRGKLVMPENAEPWEFIRSNGGRDKKLSLSESLTLTGLFDWYVNGLSDEYKATESFRVFNIHRKHVLRLLSPGTSLSSITGDALQKRYVDARAKEKGRRGDRIDPLTIRKEIATLRAIWNRAFRKKVPCVTCVPPTGDLQYPTDQDKPSFKTLSQVEEILSRGGLSELEQTELWDCLFLDRDQIAEILDYVRTANLRQKWFYPLLTLVAETGCRRSEAMRSQLGDIDFNTNTIQIREKKRKAGKITFRPVLMSDELVSVLKVWISFQRPKAGELTFFRAANKNVLDRAFRRAFRGSRWANLKGYHLFRHSMASNLARTGTEQRIIDGVLGHTTDAMRKRYRHLFPQSVADAMRKLWA